jgi:hypothetical protein
MSGDNGPTRPVLLRIKILFFRQLPGDGRFSAVGNSLEQGGHTLLPKHPAYPLKLILEQPHQFPSWRGSPCPA